MATDKSSKAEATAWRTLYETAAKRRQLLTKLQSAVETRNENMFQVA